ncbi:MAG: methionyl-tRNA formyltransferase [Parasporobacterium sp.]|nr:methionyl-tRNA formyltransferase [Parasporobacterium sp.]
MKAVYFGTPEFAVPALVALVDKGIDVAAVVTKPDMLKGRGLKISMSPVKEAALERGLTVLQPESVKDPEFIKTLLDLNADVMVVAAYSKKIPDEILNMPPLGCINIHPSLLPKYRGAAPLNEPVLNGDDVTGVCIIEMAETMDAGDILGCRELPIGPDDTAVTLEEKAAVMGAELLTETIEKLAEGTVTRIKQNEAESTYVKKINKEDGRIDFKKDAAFIERMTRAYTPWPGCYTELEGKIFKILSASVKPDSDADEAYADAEPGTVVFSGKKAIMIKTGEGLLVPERVQIEGKKPMTMEEFLRGKKIEAGYCFC